MRRNRQIRVREVRVIDQLGMMLGIMTTPSAIALAREAGLDLVEVNPRSVPPVCKILDWGRQQYEAQKAANEARKKAAVVELKEIKLRPTTDRHDLARKVQAARRFLADGDRVQLTCRFKGRQAAHPEVAERQLLAVVDSIKDLASVELSARMAGKTMTLTMRPR